MQGHISKLVVVDYNDNDERICEIKKIILKLKRIFFFIRKKWMWTCSSFSIT